MGSRTKPQVPRLQNSANGLPLPDRKVGQRRQSAYRAAEQFCPTLLIVRWRRFCIHMSNWSAGSDLQDARTEALRKLFRPSSLDEIQMVHFADSGEP